MSHAEGTMGTVGGTPDCGRGRRSEVGYEARVRPEASTASSATPKVFVAGASADGTRLLSFDRGFPTDDTVVFADDGRYELINVVEAEERYGIVHWLAEPEPLLPPRTAVATAKVNTMMLSQALADLATRH